MMNATADNRRSNNRPPKTFDDDDDDNDDDILLPSPVQESGGGVYETRGKKTSAVKINGESKRPAECEYSRNKTHCRK